jgi:AmmeMemoRadiSam system protein B
LEKTEASQAKGRALSGVPKGPILAAAAPHAGWFYSGAIAAAAVSSLDREAGTVAVIGGHLPAGMPPLFFPEDGVKTPLGDMEIDREFRDLLADELDGAPDRYQDNTVEVLLPMVRWFFPRAKLLALRLPAESASFEAGRTLARIAASLGRKLRVLGSTDLTHYGPNYGFSPQGQGHRALDWVTGVNDRRFIRAVEEGDPARILERAEGERSACSAGAVLGVLGFARETGLSPGKLLVYGTSADVAEDGEVPDSFVGYGAFGWSERSPEGL